MTVIISDAAKADLIGIGRHIAKDTPARADSFVDELERKCLGLGERPLAWPVMPQSKGRQIRRRAHGDYLIFYRIGEDHVEVVRVLHSARDYAAWLFKK
ncbi:type II toxin-antitoxin system RelE/ParE family toxin [Bosea caraganae]|uniref:type II toxin-antitoxin system RelE/ParE family toxin n=1 Tax=Bosea caraganae TaxID=2763117 RepID=UPI001AECDE58|nr:type II toxin-antitoxin system RelE/ParE family toxin [Bosea caraganae]